MERSRAYGMEQCCPELLFECTIHFIKMYGNGLKNIATLIIKLNFLVEIVSPMIIKKNVVLTGDTIFLLYCDILLFKQKCTVNNIYIGTITAALAGIPRMYLDYLDTYSG